MASQKAAINGTRVTIKVQEFLLADNGGHVPLIRTLLL